MRPKVELIRAPDSIELRVNGREFAFSLEEWSAFMQIVPPKIAIKEVHPMVRAVRHQDCID